MLTIQQKRTGGLHQQETHFMIFFSNLFDKKKNSVTLAKLCA